MHYPNYREHRKMVEESWREFLTNMLLAYNPSAREPKAGGFVVRSSIWNIARPRTKQKWFRGQFTWISSQL